MRQNVRGRREAEEAHDQSSPEGETLSVRTLRQVLQNGGVSEDASEATQQTFHMRHLWHLEGVRLRSAPAQEEAQRGIRDPL